jgi:autotransporter-associated beta strand protein
MNSVISGSGGLTVVGGGNLVLAGTNIYNGETAINDGVLILTNNGSISDSANVNVNSDGTLDASQRSDGTLAVANGQTLTGSGLIVGHAVIGSGATLSPGGALATLTFNNNLTLNSGSTTVMELNKMLSTNDVARVAGTLTYGGTLVLTNLSGILATNDSFKLFSAGSYGNAFANVVPAIPALNLAWNTNTLTSDGTLRVVTARTPPPKIGGLTSNGNNLVFRGSNGVPNWTYYVLASANAAVPLSEWQRITTNVFDAAGNFNFTNRFSPDTPRQFYLLQLQ